MKRYTPQPPGGMPEDAAAATDASSAAERAMEALRQAQQVLAAIEARHQQQREDQAQRQAHAQAVLAQAERALREEQVRQDAERERQAQALRAEAERAKERERETLEQAQAALAAEQRAREHAETLAREQEQERTQREAEQREADQREAALREAAQRQAADRDATDRTQADALAQKGAEEQARLAAEQVQQAEQERHAQQLEALRLEQARAQAQAELQSAELNRQQAQLQAEQAALETRQAELAERVNAAELEAQREAESARQEAARSQAEQAAQQLAQEQAQAQADELKRAQELADANLKIELARADAQHRIGLMTASEIARAQDAGWLDTAALHDATQKQLEELAPGLERRDALAERNRTIDGLDNEDVRAAGYDQLIAQQLPGQQHQAVEDQIKQNVEPAGDLPERQPLPPMGTLQPDVVQIESLARGMNQYAETMETLDTIEKKADAISELVKEIPEVGGGRHAEPATALAQPDGRAANHQLGDGTTVQPLASGLEAQHQTMIGIPQLTPLEQHLGHAGLGDGMMNGLPILATLGAVRAYEVFEQGREWVAQQWQRAGEPGPVSVEPGGLAFATAQGPLPREQMIDLGRNDSPLPTEPSPAEPVPAGVSAAHWQAPALHESPANAQHRHEAFFEGVPELGQVQMTGRSAEQQRAEAALAEWQSFKGEQAALDRGIAQATERGDGDVAQMLQLRKHLEGCEFAGLTSRDVQQIETTLHGADSIQATDAQLRAEDWDDRGEQARALWGANAVRSDLYQPLDTQMAEQVSGWREREAEKAEEFEQESKSLSGQELTDARAEHQARLDRDLHQAFGVVQPGLSPSHDFGY
jgi:hypothetical protein